MMDDRTLCERWLKINKFFGSIVGVWPYQEKSWKNFARFMIFITVIVGDITLIADTINSFSLATVTANTPFLILGFGIFCKQLNYIFNERKLKELIGGILHDWQVERSKEELEILETYSAKSLVFIHFYEAIMCFAVVMFDIQPFVPMALDVFIPLNESRERAFVFPGYYFFLNVDKYYYYVIIHMEITTVLIGCVFIGCDSNLVCSVQHARALMAIGGHRFKHVKDEDSSNNEKNTYEKHGKTYSKMIKCIEAHKRAIEYIQHLESCHVHCFFVTIGMVIISFTVTFVKVTSMDVSWVFLTFCWFTIAQLVHILFLTAMGQFLIDSNDDFAQAVSEGDWYKCSPKVRLLYVMVLQRCLKPTKLTGGGLIELNLDSFVQILKASVSYYTVLKST